MLRIAGWFSGVFFLIFGIYFEAITLVVLSCSPPNAAEWIPFAFYPLIPLVYGINVIWRLSVPVPPTNSEPQTPEDADNDAELAAIIQRLKSKSPPQSEDTTANPSF